jgi:hypothetical protein
MFVQPFPFETQASSAWLTFGGEQPYRRDCFKWRRSASPIPAWRRPQFRRGRVLGRQPRRCGWRALALYETVLRHPERYIAGAGHDTQVLLGALLELLLIIANIGTAVVIFPILRRQYEELALGYVTARLLECTFILVGIVSMLGIITLRNQVAGPSKGTVAYTLAAIKTGRSFSARAGSSAGGTG